MIFNARRRKETGSHGDESFVHEWESYYSVSLVFFLLNIDEIYGPLRRQELQHTCVRELIRNAGTWRRFKGHFLQVL